MPNTAKAVPWSPTAVAVEKRLKEAGIRLTMGGEPTFVVPIPDDPEWNTAALGAEKLARARRMAESLRNGPYRGGVTMQVFGKLFPGEPLPRWVLLTLKREDGTPSSRVPSRHFQTGKNAGATAKDAARLARDLAKRLGLAGYLLPAAEAAAPEKIRAHVLPLDRTEEGWVSDRWPTEESRPIGMIPGDSPAGLRLPLSSIPDDRLKRALTVEARDGCLEVFLPPLDSKAFTLLVAEIEASAEKRDLHGLLLCGYPPPDDGGVRFVRLGLAADPGVLEVNIPPATTWQDHRRILLETYAAANKAGLVASKMALNGLTTGTGGGAHFCFGGPTLEENPFFADPRRLVRLIRYWQRHPSLAYFFTGAYVGPGCQAPRIDETETSRIYEIDMACRGTPEDVSGLDRTFLDRLLRNLLTDASGNTHRAEICLDKFWNLAAPNGCLGLIEFRAFESHPDPEPLALHGLLIRSILARLFTAPFDEPLTRFGPVLHDRYFLPTFLWSDLTGICADLSIHGFPFEVDWFAPQRELRFPLLGTIDVPGGRITVRQALEAWPLMAEETRGSATVRLVDTSTDRVEVCVSDAALLREFRLAVNGVEVPMTRVDDRAIAGVRYKCASAWPALHPHIPIQSPLRFEWIRRRGREVVASADYHYWNPTGEPYPGRPANAREAEARRRARWIPGTGGRRLAPSEVRSAGRRPPESAVTLDLRWAHFGAG